MHSAINLDKKKADALVIHCADPRFQQAYRDVIDDLGVYFDLLVMPGASKAVADNDSVLESIKLLHGLHHFETVHIIDHIECAAFGPVADEQNDHSNYLAKASDKIRGILPELKVVPHLLGESQELTVDL